MKLNNNDIKKRRIGFIGAGKVGTSLGKYLSLNGFNVCEYYSRTKKSAEDSAKFIGGCTAVSSIGDMTADTIFITVSDDSITEIANDISLLDKDKISGKVFCHTSGSLPADVLSPIKDAGKNSRTASLHMLLAVNSKYKSYRDFGKAFFTLDGCGADDIREIITYCGNKSRIIDSRYKAKYHAAAVFVSNFAAALANTGCTLLTECGFSYDEALNALAPLIKNNTENIINDGPQKALTGPARRGDFGTLEKHRACLSGAELQIYNDITNYILNQFK